jgi:dTDP-4-amino-4,6-dideoxy-D-galactose acyltransferase
VTDSNLCEYLEWDSEFFKRRIARLKSNRLSADELEATIAWTKSESIDCLYFLADSNDSCSIRSAEAFGFELVDIRITLERRLDQAMGKASSVIRPARESDIPTLKSIARISHQDSRFYYDGRFPEDLCNALYEVWIEKSCKGYANAVLVPESNGTAAGYISCHLPGPATGQIGLVGVAPDAQGRRLGQELVQGAMHWFGLNGVDRVLVVTQGRNLRAQRLYQRCGFITQSLQLWYHKWFPNPDRGGKQL